MKALISLTGYSNSGKSTIAHKLAAQYGFNIISGSGMLKDAHAALPEDQRPPLVTRADYLNFNNIWREQCGIDAMAQKVLEFQKTNPGLICYDGVRNFSDAKTLQRNGSLIVALTCTFNERFERATLAKKERDSLDRDAFFEDERIEANSPDPLGLHIQKVMEIADLTINTSQPIENVIKDLRGALKTWGIRF